MVLVAADQYKFGGTDIGTGPGQIIPTIIFGVQVDQINWDVNNNPITLSPVAISKESTVTNLLEGFQL